MRGVRAAAGTVLALAMGSACGGPSGLNSAAREVIGRDATCVEAQLDDDAIAEINRTLDGDGRLSPGARQDLARASAVCSGNPLPDDVATGDDDRASDGGTSPSPDVGPIGRDPLDPDARVIAGPDAPLSVGSTVELADWDITVLAAGEDTGPAAGRSSQGGLYVITIRATNRGDGESDVFFDIDWGVIATDGTIYENTCGVALDDDLAFADSAPPGATQEGSLCLDMPAAVAAATTEFYLQESFTEAEAIAWFTTG